MSCTAFVYLSSKSCKMARFLLKTLLAVVSIISIGICISISICISICICISISISIALCLEGVQGLPGHTSCSHTIIICRSIIMTCCLVNLQDLPRHSQTTVFKQIWHQQHRHACNRSSIPWMLNAAGICDVTFCCRRQTCMLMCPLHPRG